MSKARTLSDLASGVAGSPVGSISAFSNAVPSDYLECNGAAVSRTTYADLFSYLSTTYGVGNGSTTFNLPDLRGEFIRGLDNGRGVDTSRVLGTGQNFDWKSLSLTNTLMSQSSGYSHNDVYLGKSTTSYTGKLFTGYWSNPSASIGGKWDNSEPRPRNVAMYYGIKY